MTPILKCVRICKNSYVIDSEGLNWLTELRALYNEKQIMQNTAVQLSSFVIRNYHNLKNLVTLSV